MSRRQPASGPLASRVSIHLYEDSQAFAPANTGDMAQVKMATKAVPGAIFDRGRCLAVSWRGGL
jgi:hypothetical protein